MTTLKTMARLFAAAALMSVTATAAMAAAAEPTAVVTVSVSASAAAPFQSRDRADRRVRIHNQTGWTMSYFYASNVNVSNWEEDILGADVLASGDSLIINIDDGTGACMFDFKAVFTNGQELIRNNVNVCQIADYYYTR